MRRAGDAPTNQPTHAAVFGRCALLSLARVCLRPRPYADGDTWHMARCNNVEAVVVRHNAQDLLPAELNEATGSRFVELPIVESFRPSLIASSSSSPKDTASFKARSSQGEQKGALAA